MQLEKTIFWLKAASMLVIGFGLILSLAAYPATSGLAYFYTDLAFWPLDGEQNLTYPETRILCAVLGGVMAGWGVLLYQISTKLFPREPALARSLIFWSIGVWFVTDVIGSLVAGVPINAVLNIGFLLAFVVPLINRKKHISA